VGPGQDGAAPFGSWVPGYGVVEGLAEAAGAPVAALFLALCLCWLRDTDSDAEVVGVGAGE
jgi:hypothetical protein